MKTNFAERVIQTLKKSLWRYMHAEKNYRYRCIKRDRSFCTKHRTMGMKPSEVTKGHVERCLWWHIYKPTE